MAATITRAARRRRAATRLADRDGADRCGAAGQAVVVLVHLGETIGDHGARDASSALLVVGPSHGRGEIGDGHWSRPERVDQPAPALTIRPCEGRLGTGHAERSVRRIRIRGCSPAPPAPGLHRA